MNEKIESLKHLCTLHEELREKYELLDILKSSNMKYDKEIKLITARGEFILNNNEVNNFMTYIEKEFIETENQIKELLK